MSADNLVTIHTLKDANMAEVIRNALQSEGIKCELDGEHQAGLTGILSIGVLVRECDQDRAKEIIESHES